MTARETKERDCEKRSTFTVDEEKAEQIARKSLARELSGECRTSDVDQLCGAASVVAQLLESGDNPQPEDLADVRSKALDVIDTIEQVALLHGMNPYDIGVPFGQLSPEQRQELEERE